MSIALAAVLAGVAGVGARNIVGWLKSNDQFNVRNSVASGLIAFITSVPLIITGFSAAFQNVESLPEETQLLIFITQVGTVAGFDALAKGGMTAAIKK